MTNGKQKKNIYIYGKITNMAAACHLSKDQEDMTYFSAKILKL